MPSARGHATVQAAAGKAGNGYIADHLEYTQSCAISLPVLPVQFIVACAL